MADISDETFYDEISIFGLKIKGDDVYDKLRHLCETHHLSADDMVAACVAFSHSHHQCPLTSEILDTMERERLNKPSGKLQKKTPAKSSSAAIYDINTLPAAVDADTADQLLGAYGTPTGKGINKRQHTPENIQSKRLTGVARNPAVPFSPASFSPSSGTPSRKYSGRTNSGDVVCEFGPSANASWRSTKETPCSISPYDTACTLTQRLKYMFQKLTDKAHILNDQIEDMAEKLKAHYNIEEFSHVALPIQESVTVVGRIGCDSNGKLNSKSVVLEGSRETSGGKQIAVDLSSVPQFSLFPGQIAAMEGINSTGMKFVAEKVFEGIPLALPENSLNIDKGAVRVVVAVGPFTTSDSTMFEPLVDLITYLQKDPPDVCVLMGPFLDTKHAELEKGLGSKTFEEFFRSIVEKIVDGTRSVTQIVLVPSQRDVHHDPVYPQPPFILNNMEKRLHLVSDPCTLTVDGVVMGITSTDVLFHLGTEEISGSPGSSDRLSRLARHILTQHNFYPMCPPSDEVNVDFDAFEVHAKLPVTPHILLIPSELRYFVKDVCGCCCVNPGRLAKGQVGGTYARLVIKPGSVNDTQTSLVSNIAAQVVRI